jgi:hypothetical protein
MTARTGIHRLQIGTMRYTPYMEQCRQELSKGDEYSSDEVLAHCVTVQQMQKRSGVSPRQTIGHSMGLRVNK